MKLLSSIFVCIALSLSFMVMESPAEQVKGHAKKSGTYVNSYLRNKRNKTKINKRPKGNKKPKTKKAKMAHIR